MFLVGFWFSELAALSNDSQTVIFKVSKPVGDSLDEYHFAMEALSNPVAPRNSPHRNDLLHPIDESSGTRFHGLESIVYGAAN